MSDPAPTTKPPWVRRDSSPPFEVANELRTTHGANSPRRVDPLMTALLSAVAGDDVELSWLRPADQPSVRAWARTEARITLVSEWLALHGGDLDEHGEVRAASHLLNRLEARAESLRSKLGFDPLSRAKLGKDVAATGVDLAKLWMAEDAVGAQEPTEGELPPDGATAPQAGAQGAHRGP